MGIVVHGYTNMKLHVLLVIHQAFVGCKHTYSNSVKMNTCYCYYHNTRLKSQALYRTHNFDFNDRWGFLYKLKKNIYFTTFVVITSIVFTHSRFIDKRIKINLANPVEFSYPTCNTVLIVISKYLQHFSQW